MPDLRLVARALMPAVSRLFSTLIQFNGDEGRQATTPVPARQALVPNAAKRHR
jgi:hypothetical protein